MSFNDYKAVYVDKSKAFATWAKENSFKGIVSKPALPAKAEPKRSDIQFINMDGANWDKTKVLLEELSSEYETKLKTVEHKADRRTIQKGPGEVDITSSAMRLSSGLNEITVHEFAHTLAVEKADKLGISDNRLFWNEIRKIRTAYRKDRAKNPNISISAYADNPGKNPLDEFMAEAFAHAKCAEKGIKISGYGADYTYSKQVLETIDRYFKRAKYTPKASSQGSAGNGIIEPTEGQMGRRKANIGEFKGLEVPMQLRAVKQVCAGYGYDISGLRLKIQRDPYMLDKPYYAIAANDHIGRIDLFPPAFANKELLMTTIIHEKIHVLQFRKYGAEFVQENRALMEKVAYRAERLIYRLLKRRR
jgi:hypothetical protein